MPGYTIEMKENTRQGSEVISDQDLNNIPQNVKGQDSENKPHSKASPKPEDSRSNGSTEDDNLDLSCGIGKLRTNFFGTKFANLYAFSICFGLSNLFAQMVSQVIQVQLTSLERQFNIDNAKAGLFETASRIGFISTLLFAGHFAKKYNIPLIIGAAGVVQGLILTVPAIMQYVDPYKLPILPPSTNTNGTDKGESAQYLCDSTGVNATGDTNSGEMKHIQFIVILVVQAIKGLTDTFHNGFLPILYMDDNLLDKSKMGIILGIWQVITELSGPLGKQINGILTEVPIDLIDSEMGPEDGRFVSAWWLAFLVFGIGTAVFSFPIMIFPRSLVTDRQRQEALKKAVVTFAGGEVPDEVEEPQKIQEQSTGPESQQTITVGEETNSGSSRRRYSVTDLHSRTTAGKDIARRDSGIQRFSSRRRSSLFPTIVGETERKVSITGDLVFEQPIKRQESHKEENLTALIKDFPKALIRIFKIPVIVLLLVDIAVVSVPFSGTSIFRNTYMVNEYNVSMSEVALVSGITTAVGSILGTVVSSWLSSRVTTKMGYALIIACTWFVTIIVVPFYFIFGCSNVVVYGAEGEIGRPVNLTDCNCTLSHQLISCGDDGNNYLSPCFAGCTDVSSKHFTKCSLLNDTEGQSVTPGLCSTDCHDNFIIYAALHGIQFFFYAVSMIPRRLLVLRVVDPQDRGFATSLFNFCFILTGIPSTNLFGGVIDGTCLIWDNNMCTLYDRDKIRNMMSGIDMSVHACVQITFILMVVIFKCEEMKVKRTEKKKKDIKEEQVIQADPKVTGAEIHVATEGQTETHTQAQIEKPN